MQSGAIASFEGIVAYGDVFRGLGWHLVDIDGWTDGPAVDAPRAKRPGQDGGFALPGTLEEREPRLSGFLVAESHHDLELASAGFRWLTNRFIWLTITDMYGTFSVQGLVTRAAFRNHGFAPEGTWQLEMQCADPYKYGESELFAEAQMLSHRGHGDAIPTISVTATTTMTGGYTIVGPGGSRYVVAQTLPAGSTHLIDMATGWILLDGTLQIGAVTRADLWVVPPGAPRFAHRLEPVSGSGVLTTSVRDRSN